MKTAFCVLACTIVVQVSNLPEIIIVNFEAIINGFFSGGK